MTELPTNDSLAELQRYVRQMNIERDFNSEDASKKLVMLMEEVGELAKAVRKQVGLKFASFLVTYNPAFCGVVCNIMHRSIVRHALTPGGAWVVNLAAA